VGTAGVAATSRVALALAIAVLAGCGGDSSTGSDLPKGGEEVNLDPSSFTLEIDNRYWPMSPGTRWIYRGTGEGGEQRDVVTVTRETKRVANGITARVLRDTATEDGEVVEDTFDWYAQDADGNVWYLGEDTAELDGGKVTSRAGSWEAGVDGALPGVVVPAEPADGQAYRQEYYAGEAEDNGEVLSVDEQVEVPAGRYAGALLTKDTSAIETDVVEYKLYAPDVGPALALGISGEAGREELLRVERVSAEAARDAGTSPLGQPYR